MTAKEILRQHLHGYSDEQFEVEINKFPLNECLHAMNRILKDTIMTTPTSHLITVKENP